jgi:hypothetical protein
MVKFATYLHPHTCFTSKPPHLISFVGHSYPHYSQSKQELEKALVDYPSVPVRKAEFSDYERVHSSEYLSDILPHQIKDYGVGLLKKLTRYFTQWWKFFLNELLIKLFVKPQ